MPPQARRGRRYRGLVNDRKRMQTNERLPNKGMKLTKLRAAPVRRVEVPPCAFRRFAAARTASQLIPGVRRTCDRGRA